MSDETTLSGRCQQGRGRTWRGLKRGLKAGASIGLALVAGAFLACKSKLPSSKEEALDASRGQPTTTQPLGSGIADVESERE